MLVRILYRREYMAVSYAEEVVEVESVGHAKDHAYERMDRGDLDWQVCWDGPTETLWFETEVVEVT